MTFVPRGHCTVPFCHCPRAVFTRTEYRLLPLDANENCNCDHKWWEHLACPTLTARRGTCPSVHCGGYISSDALAINAPCVCGETYGSHEPLVSATSETHTSATQSMPTEPRRSSDSVLTSAAVIAQNPPVFAYTNSLVPRWTPSDTLPTTAANEQRKEAAKRHRRSKPAAQRQKVAPAASISESDKKVELNCAVWPFLLEKKSFHGYIPIQPSFTTRDLGEVVETLSANHLVFPLSLDYSSNDAPWLTINQALHAQFDTYGIKLPSRERDLGQQFTRLSWDLIVPNKTKKGKNTKLTFRSGAAGPTTFTIDFLCEQAIEVDIEDEPTDIPFILIAPRAGHLLGPVYVGGGLSPEAHPCFPWRIFENKTECMTDLCPSLEPSWSAALESNELRRSRSISPGMLNRNTRPRYDTPSIGEEAQPNPTDKVEDSDEDDINDLIANAGSLPKLQSLEVWQSRIRSASSGTFTIKAPTTEVASDAFVHLLKSLVSGTDLISYHPEDPLVIVELTQPEALLSFHGAFQIRKAADVHTAIGNGPTASVFQAALKKRIENTERWGPIHGEFYLTLELSTPGALLSQDTLLEYQVDGMLTALTMLHTLSEPYGVNPFLVYAAFFDSPEAIDFLAQLSWEDYRYEYLLAMIPDKGTRKTVAKVFKFEADTNIPVTSMARHPLGQLAMAFMSIPPNYFTKDRDESQHTTVKRQMLSQLLVGHVLPWDQPQFTFFARGLRLGFCNPRIDFDIDKDLYLYAFLMITTIWSRRITKPSDITDIIKYSLIDAHNSAAGRIFRDLFEKRLTRWLCGQGHPNELVGSIVSDELNKKSLKSPHTIRAEMFWNAVSDLTCLPAIGDVKIHVCIYFEPELADNENHCPLYFHTCAKVLDVKMGQLLMNLLVEPMDSPDSTDDTRFDVWFHKLIVHAANDYNRT